MMSFFEYLSVFNLVGIGCLVWFLWLFYQRLDFLENFFEQLSDCVDVDAFKAYCDIKYKGEKK